MRELFQLAIAPEHLFYTLLLIPIFLYWLSVFIGALDMDFLDFDMDGDVEMEVDLDIDLDIDVDVDVDVDVEADVDVDADVDSDVDSDADASGGSWFTGVLHFFNLGSVPFMIFMSFLVLFLWASSIMNYHYWGSSYPWFPAFWLIPNLLIALFLTKAFTAPFKRSYKAMNKEGIAKKQLVGKLCELTLNLQSGKIGQAELHGDEGNFLIYVKSQGDIPLTKGTQALIVEYDAEQDYYWVQAFEL